MGTEIVSLADQNLVRISSSVDGLLSEIRPEWQAKDLINRVKRILPADPSSACQRLLNAAVHDLRDKIIIAGLDVAAAAADEHKLPSIKKPDDVEELSTTHTLDLAYRMGIITRPDWRRLKRAYDIRKDLEHEDDEYEAGIEDCVYVFSTCIEIVLSKDPISPVKVSEIKDIIESPDNVKLSIETIEDYQRAPISRQVEIYKFLISAAENAKNTDIVRQNSVEALISLKKNTNKTALSTIGSYIQEKKKDKPLTTTDLKIANAGGYSPYLKQSKVKTYLDGFIKEIDRAGYEWRSNNLHSEIFDDLDDIGGLSLFKDEQLEKIIEWMTLAFLGEPGGYGAGTHRSVFYSNTASPRIRKIFKEHKEIITKPFSKIKSSTKIKKALASNQIKRRLETLIDILEN